MGLQQEHVVAVEMRPHTPAVSGVADHQVVQPRLGHKAELLQQLVHPVVECVHALHQQGPAALAERRDGAALERALAHAPTARGIGQLLHQP